MAEVRAETEQLRAALAETEHHAAQLAAQLQQREAAAELQAAAVRELRATYHGVRQDWRRTDAALAEATSARRATEQVGVGRRGLDQVLLRVPEAGAAVQHDVSCHLQSKLALVEALIQERAARIMAQQEGGADRTRLALLEDERRTLALLQGAVHEMQAQLGGLA